MICASAILLLAAFVDESGRVGAVELFGYAGLDAAAIRAAVGVKPGDQFPPRNEVTRRVRSQIGKEITFTRVCCNPEGRSVLFVGVPGDSARALTYRPAPNGSERAPKPVLAAYNAEMDAVSAMVRGQAKDFEKESAALRTAAAAHEEVLYTVLEQSSEWLDRAAAAHGLGKLPATPKIVKSLTNAVNDANSVVRNNATRALGVYAGDAKLRPLISGEPFIEMLWSLDWTDRNKALMVLSELVKDDNPALLKALREKAAVPLKEMAAWTSEGWAYSAREILKRFPD